MAESVPSPEFRCLLCQEIYKSPRELPCGHTFCCPCLTTNIQAEHVSADEDRHFFPCPVCHTPIVPRDPSVHVNTWATSFPINHLFLAPTTRTSGDHVCEACLRDGESCTAEVWCTDCAEMLCKQCKTCPKRSKVSTKHRLVPISGEEGKGIQDITVNDMCPQHDAKSLDFYCMDHRSMCCSVCVTLSHRNCNNIKPLDDVIHKTAPGKRYHETEWKDIREETKKMLEDDNSQMIKLNSKEKQACAEMTQVIQLAKDKLDDLNTTFQSDLVRKCNTYRKQMASRLRCVSKFNTNSENSHLLMSLLQKQGSDRQAFITTEKTKNQMSGHYRRMDQYIKKQDNTFDITLKIAPIVNEIMKMTTIGNVDVTSSLSPTSQNANASISTLLETVLLTPSATTFADSTSASDLTDSLQHVTVQTTSAPTMVDVWTATVSCVQTVHSSTLGGSHTPCLSGGTFTDSGQLLITDGGNGRLLLFDDKYSFLREYNVDGPVIDVKRGRFAEEMFVALHEGQILRCTLRNDELIVIDKITGPYYTCEIAVHGDGIMVGTMYSVDVLSMGGRVTRSITKSNDCTHLAVSTSTASLYYTDEDDIVCRRLDSDAVVYTYSDAGLKGPMGIGVDRDDNVYVCGDHTNNVYLVSPDGSRGKALVTTLDSNSHPYGIVVHPTKQEFVVTSLRDPTSFEVYRFSNNAC